MHNFETIRYTVEQRVATISLNQPKTLNAISQRMRQELKQAIDACEADDEVRVVVLSAQGRGFCSGTDLSEGLAGYDNIEAQLLEEYKPVLMAIHQSDKLFIASIHGVCAGVGAALAMTCDLAVMADDAYLFLAFAGLSLVPDGGMSFHLVNAMGYKRAIQLFAESGRLSAEQCVHYGLANKHCAAENLVAETTHFAQSLAQGAPLAQKFGKQIMRSVHDSDFETIFHAESRLQTTCMDSTDSKNAVAAFFKKEKAVFIGE
ncbi:Short-chain-enoyl-CoA hydratase [Sinobacterium norvegicum]|uniref:Short-chain-enoyl-CoA hydratase n=1 Tax=Sinobacterium norvegicum TaxID=1641715 RepID=A0ABN8EMY4_9GAMM|nr:enoyl-CoA hydratase/isomerase family protein [Sinobacterium norvegicum]CAH0993100.1 Short-chain-enoyl-CoA hydratase [Sinobacterium norvegicum]